MHDAIRHASKVERGRRLSTLAERWRQRADELDRYAARCRRLGDTIEAQDAEQAAVDYRVAADELI